MADQHRVFIEIRTLAGDEATLEYCPSNSYAIECLGCANRPHWCRHIAHAIVTRLDTKAIWTEVPIEFPEFYDLPLVVPVFPNTGQFTEVKLTHKSDTYKEIEWAQATTVAVPFSLGNDVIGSLQPGEGLQVIRSMLTEKMIADYGMAQLRPACAAAHHSVAAQSAWVERTDSSSPLRLAECWSVYTTDWCIYCKENNPAGVGPDGQHDPDLLPDNPFPIPAGR